ncbi:hypothetical protein PVAP13_1NG505100 [Panicum virgatum]|uniref:Uncharacterized protein n=1 Tax=Panicum virgatum TaxID=38727 RepID=A0A8T0XBA5_PANVG|nr:hypothetical protein PVAP13_1NG505100 [Panicum virgatum]
MPRGRNSELNDSVLKHAKSSRIVCWMLQKSLLDATEKERQESLEYKNCLLDATEKSKTIQQYDILSAVRPSSAASENVRSRTLRTRPSPSSPGPPHAAPPRTSPPLSPFDLWSLGGPPWARSGGQVRGSGCRRSRPTMAATAATGEYRQGPPSVPPPPPAPCRAGPSPLAHGEEGRGATVGAASLCRPWVRPRLRCARRLPHRRW